MVYNACVLPAHFTVAFAARDRCPAAAWFAASQNMQLQAPFGGTDLLRKKFLQNIHAVL
jgi:hypothetical protein